MIKTESKFYCDFCGAENIESQFTRIDVRGCIYGPEIACPMCLGKILSLLGQLRDAGPQHQPTVKGKGIRQWLQDLRVSVTPKYLR